MTTAGTDPSAVPGRAGCRLLPALDRKRDAVRHLGPNWFAAVMGTGIVATAAVGLPDRVQGQQQLALVLWFLAASLLFVLLVATAAHWVLHPTTARGHLTHPVMGHFYGAPPMAVLTVGAGALLVGRDAIGLHAALVVDWVLWSVGTLLGLATAGVVPVLVHARRGYAPDAAFGGWLMPVVPPMVSATTGGLLLPHLPQGWPRLTMLVGCYALFAGAVVASVIVARPVLRRVVAGSYGAAATVPTLWIVVGPLGQSATAAHVLGRDAGLAVSEGTAHVAAVFGVAYGAVALAGALVWLVVAGTVTVRTARQELPFSLTWWSFTFPVGTVVTGTTGLAVATGSRILDDAATVLFVGLLVAWATVAVRTARGVVHGRLLLPPALPA